MILIKQLDYGERRATELYASNDKEFVVFTIGQLRIILGHFPYQKYTPSETELLIELANNVIKHVERIGMLADGKIIIYCTDGASYDVSNEDLTRQSLWLVLKHIVHYCRRYHLYIGCGRYSHQIKRMHEHTLREMKSRGTIKDIFIRIMRDIFKRREGPYYQWSFRNDEIRFFYQDKIHQVTMVEMEGSKLYVYISDIGKKLIQAAPIPSSTLIEMIESVVYNSQCIKDTVGHKFYFVKEKNYDFQGERLDYCKLHYVFPTKKEAIDYIEGLTHVNAKAKRWNKNHTKYKVSLPEQNKSYVIIRRKKPSFYTWNDEGQRVKNHKLREQEL